MMEHAKQLPLAIAIIIAAFVFGAVQAGVFLPVFFSVFAVLGAGAFLLASVDHDGDAAAGYAVLAGIWTLGWLIMAGITLPHLCK